MHSGHHNLLRSQEVRGMKSNVDSCNPDFKRCFWGSHHILHIICFISQQRNTDYLQLLTKLQTKHVPDLHGTTSHMQAALLLLKELALTSIQYQGMPLTTQERKKVENIVCTQYGLSESKIQHRQLSLDMYHSVLPPLWLKKKSVILQRRGQPKGTEHHDHNTVTCYAT